MDNHKLGIIVPFRNRHEHLKFFLKEIEEYLFARGIEYIIIVIEQDDAKLFNRGMILNIGFTYAKKNKCDYVVFHDVDMIPVDGDYSYSPHPIHMATNFVYNDANYKRETFKEYFGGVTLFPVDIFEKINGYSNKYWGWGFEDDDLLFRCKVNNVDMDEITLKNVGSDGNVLKFNGVNSYIKCENTIDFNLSATFLINFDINSFVLDHTKDSDEFSVFSIPGWDFAICYNSFSRFNFCAFDINKNPHYINTEITPSHRVTIAVVMNRVDNKFSMYVNGEFIGETESFKRLLPYKKQKYFYLGVGNPNREDKPNYLNGIISSFCYYDDILNENEILKLSLSKDLYTQVLLSKKPKIYFNTNQIKHYKLIDLSGNNQHNEIVGCEIVKQTIREDKIVKIPHRRNCSFKSLKHEENGFSGEGWKDQSTRWNQLRFKNEVLLNQELLKDDGLSDLKFVEWGEKKENNVLHVNVGI